MSKHPVDARGSLIATNFFGIGLMAAAIDGIVFHQILAWHHFFDRSTQTVGLISDGLLHSAGLLMLAAGLYLFVQLGSRRAVSRLQAWAGLLLGAGGFQLFRAVAGVGVFRHLVPMAQNLRETVIDDRRRATGPG